ncbi:MAG: hypothetical protein H6642_13425 [Caldilineaceae bacterium]|nr:hypothetical protein [Caldilineaceae bacterium]MCB9139341.1 hypothetical protein [Caldilineaceae bacterium]
MNLNINLRNVQEQIEENSEQVRKYAHKAALAYTGLWALAYDSARSGLENSVELLEKAEKRGEEVETEFNRQYNRYYDQATSEFKKLQERYAGRIDLEESTNAVTRAVNENAKAVQESLSKALSKVGISDLDAKEIEESVIEVQKAVDDTAGVIKEAMKNPLERYDGLTVQDVIGEMDKMTNQELQEVLAYEKAHKDRVTLIRELEERLGMPIDA